MPADRGRIFISWYDGERHPDGARLKSSIEQAGFQVVHSPCSPHSGRTDERWKGWYESGCARAVADCGAFIAFIEDVYDSSTWMGIEFDVAWTANQRTGWPKLFYLKALGRRVRPGFSTYLAASQELPRDDRAIAMLRAALGGAPDPTAG